MSHSFIDYPSSGPDQGIVKDLSPSATSGTPADAIMGSLKSLADRVSANKFRLGLNSRSTFVYDDFDRTNRLLNGDKTPTGQTWYVSGPGQNIAAISSGKVVSSSNYYAYLPYGGSIERIEGTFSLDSTNAAADRTTTSVTLIASNASGGLSDMLHLIVGPDGWMLQKRVSNGSFDGIASGSHNLRTDETVYHVAMEINTTAGTVMIIPPSGQRVTVTDAAITAINPTHLCIQYIPSSTASVGRWHSVAMGPTGSTADSVRATGGGAAASDVAFLMGTGLTRRQRVDTTLTGAGWYRIANKAVVGTFAIVGKLIISAQDQYRLSWCEVDLKTFLGGATPSVVQQFAAANGGGCITKVRLSRDDNSPYGAGLDVYLPNADTVALSLEFFGGFDLPPRMTPTTILPLLR